MRDCHFGNKARKLNTQKWPSCFQTTLTRCFVQLRDAQQVCGFSAHKSLPTFSWNSFGMGASPVAEHRERKYCYRSRCEETEGRRFFQSSLCVRVGKQKPVVLTNTDPCWMGPADSAQIQLHLLNF